MTTYYVGDEDEHLVDHPPLFACREHKKMLRLSARFVDELIACGQDIMPGNPQEIAASFLKEAELAYKLPEFLLPPKWILFNPRGLRGAEALPYAVVLVDKRFFGIPARYLSPDRFDGCDECKTRRRRGARPQPRARRGPPGKATESGRRRPPGPGSEGMRPPSSESGRRPGTDSSIRRPPSKGGPRRGPRPPGHS